MTIACLPIEIDVSLPDEQKVLDYVQEYQFPSMLHLTSPRFDPWIVSPILGRMPSKDWNDAYKIRDLIYNRQNPNYGGKLEWANGFDKLFPEIVYMIEQIPILNPIVIFMQQTALSTAHEDKHGGDIMEDPSQWTLYTEPRRYNIQMTNFDYKSFFVSKTRDGERIPYNHISKELPAYVFCEQHYFHGAEYCGPNKVSLCFLGTPDWPRHNELIRKNLEKHRDKAIIFEDDNDLLHK